MNLEKELLRNQGRMPRQLGGLHNYAKHRGMVENLASTYGMDTTIGSILKGVEDQWLEVLTDAIEEHAHEGLFVLNIHGANILLRFGHFDAHLMRYRFEDTNGLVVTLPIERVVDAKIVTSKRFRGAMQLRLS